MTTNNHPAHGPVSLDRLHQISEILSKAVAQSDGGNLGYAMADAVKVIDGAIAAFGAEPVAYMYKDKLHADASFSLDTRFGNCSQEDINEYEITEIPLYTAPPALVVPPAIEPDYEVIKSILPTANPDEYACCIAADMWNACRAAMLQAGNSPVTPDCWIPVSERMPADGDIVLVVDDGCFVCEAQHRSGNFYSTARGGDDFFETECRDVAHWMPLPAAPQQEVK